MPNPPLISIITIVYNDLQGLKKTVRSVLDQKYANIEYIVIDGASNDGSAEYIKEMASSFSFSISEKDNGIADAFNKGVKRSNGEWILFLNSADYFYTEDCLAKIAVILGKENERDVVFGKINLIDDKGISKGVFGKPFDLESFHREMTIPHQAAFHNQRIFKEHGLFGTEYKYCMDYELLLRIKKPNFLFVDLIVANMLSGGVSQESPKEVYKEFNKVKSLHLKFSNTRLKLDLYENLIRNRLSRIKRRVLNYGNKKKMK